MPKCLGFDQGEYNCVDIAKGGHYIPETADGFKKKDLKNSYPKTKLETLFFSGGFVIIK